MNASLVADPEGVNFATSRFRDRQFVSCRSRPEFDQTPQAQGFHGPVAELIALPFALAALVAAMVLALVVRRRHSTMSRGARTIGLLPIWLINRVIRGVDRREPGSTTRLTRRWSELRPAALVGYLAKAASGPKPLSFKRKALNEMLAGDRSGGRCDRDGRSTDALRYRTTRRRWQ